MGEKNKPFDWETFWRRKTYCVFDFCFEKANARFFVASHLLLLLLSLLSSLSSLSSLSLLYSCVAGGGGGGSVGLAGGCLLFSSSCCTPDMVVFAVCSVVEDEAAEFFSVLLATEGGCHCCYDHCLAFFTHNPATNS